MGEWREYKIGDIGSFSYGKMPKKDKLNTGNYSIFSGYKYQYTYPENNCTKGDLIVVARGVGGTGNVKIVKEDCFLTNLSLKMNFDNNIVDSKFVYYYYFIETLRYLDSGSAQSQITINDLSKAYISLPPLKEQKAIAEVLSSFDNKIELLHRQNKTLEELAQTLFRQWFIEEAKSEWEEVIVGDFVQSNVATIKKDSYLKTIQYLDTSSLTEGKIDSYQQLDLSEAPSRAKRIVKHNDVLISTVRPNQKHYGIIKNPTENIIVSTGYCVISCEKINPHFIYILLTMDDMTEYLHSIAEGSTSTYPSLKPSDIEAIEFLLAPEEKLQKFSNYADNAWEKIDKNHTQIKTLENMIDTLIPKLMSGKVKLKI